jgi:hypothetical protein
MAEACRNAQVFRFGAVARELKARTGGGPFRWSLSTILFSSRNS